MNRHAACRCFVHIVARSACVAGVLALAWFAAGCSAGPRNYLNDNDTLRAENLKLQQNVEELEGRLADRIGEIEALRSKYEREGVPIPGAEPPVLSSIKYDRYTSPVDTNNDGVDDTMRVYLLTLDQDGRWIPISGLGRLQVAVIPEQGEPYMVIDQTYTPQQIRDAYRYSIMGVNYTFDAPLPKDLSPDVKQVTAKYTLTDAATGATFVTTKSFRLTPPTANNR